MPDAAAAAECALSSLVHEALVSQEAGHQGHSQYQGDRALREGEDKLHGNYVCSHRSDIRLENIL